MYRRHHVDPRPLVLRVDARWWTDPVIIAFLLLVALGIGSLTEWREARCASGVDPRTSACFVRRGVAYALAREEIRFAWADVVRVDRSPGYRKGFALGRVHLTLADGRRVKVVDGAREWAYQWADTLEAARASGGVPALDARSDPGLGLLCPTSLALGVAFVWLVFWLARTLRVELRVLEDGSALEVVQRRRIGVASRRLVPLEGVVDVEAESHAMGKRGRGGIGHRFAVVVAGGSFRWLTRLPRRYRGAPEDVVRGVRERLGLVTAP